MKSIIISSDCSGGGKTTVTLALMQAIKNKGYSVQGYKVGPDYIDSAFHKQVTGIKTRNLDAFLIGEDGVKECYSRGKGDFGVIEGVMGLYDGKGCTIEYSTAHISKILNLPVVLVLSPKAQALTLCAEIEGMRNFGKVNIAGVILNGISESYYELLKILIEKNCIGIKVFGYVPKDERISLPSRHLGLVQSCEIDDIKERIKIAGELLEKHVNIEDLLTSCCESKQDVVNNNEFSVDYCGRKIAVAYDEAFSFYYKENLELLEEAGEVVYFSPLRDKELPKDVDFIYIGGGYPEVFKKQLSENKTMLESIKRALDSGVRCYAECGGLMYLMESIEGEPMVGFFSGISIMTNRLNNFGYAAVNVTEDNSILSKGLKINCHEFHKSIVETDEKAIFTMEKESYDGSIKEWAGGYYKNNTIAAYAHLHFFGNIELFKELMKL